MQRFAIFCAVLFVSASGCGTQGSAVRPYPAPSADELLSAVRARAERVRAVDLETRTTSYLGGDRVVAKVLMLVERVGNLRFEAEVTLRGTVAILTTHDRSFALLDMEQNTLKRGAACPENVASLVRLPLAPREVAAILLGDAPIAANARATDVGWDGRSAEVLTIEQPAEGRAARRLRVLLRQRRDGAAIAWDVVGVEGESPGRGAWRVAYDDLESDGGIRFPRIIRFAEPGKSFDDGVEIKVRDRRANPTIRPEVFELSAPEGFRVVELPCPADD